MAEILFLSCRNMNHRQHTLSLLGIILLMCFLDRSLKAQSQLIHLPDGTYIDSTGKMDTLCKDLGIYYFQVGAKYPMSSDALLQKLNAMNGSQTGLGNKSGWITFQFMIDCEGKLVRKVKLIQTDANHKAADFPMEGIDKLYQFILSLDGWKPATLQNGKYYPYHSFFSFKINHGKVERIIP